MTAPALFELECLQVRGTPRAMGGAHGEHFRARIADFIEMRLDALVQYLRERGIDKLQPMQQLASRSLAMLERWHPQGHEEHCAVAAGARVDAVRLHWAAQMTDLRDAYLLSAASGPVRAAAPAEGCSALLLPGRQTADGQVLVGQTWDLNPQDLDFVVALDRRPVDAPRSLCITCVGSPSLVGMNQAGLAVGTTNIKTYASRPGVAYLNVLHRLLEAPSTEVAASLLRSAPLAAAHTYWLADAEGARELEASPSAIVERSAAQTPLCRTNHCLAPEHRDLEAEAPSLSSQKRLAQLEAFAASAVQADVESLRQLFADRTAGALSINRYPEDAQGTATNAVAIMRPATRELWACRGPADRGQWQHWDLRA